MNRGLPFFALAIVGALLTACADEDAQNPPVPPPTYVTNNTYNGPVIYETTSAATDASVARPSASSAGAESSRNSLHAGTPRDLATTGVAECDAYLARVESCSGAVLPRSSQSEALDRITSSLDTARRAWRHAALNPSERPALASTCSDALTQYNASVTNVVCE